MDAIPLTDEEKALVEQYVPMVYWLRDRAWPKEPNRLRTRAGYGIEDVTQAGFVAMMEAVQAWPAISRRCPVLKIEAFLVARTKRAMVKFQVEHSHALFIPESRLWEARNPRKDKKMSDVVRGRLLEGGKRKALHAALIRDGVRRGASGKPMMGVPREDQPPEWLGQRARLRAAIVEAASRYSGARGEVADLLIAERIPVSSRLHRTGYQSIANRTGLKGQEVKVLERRILNGARRAMEGKPPARLRTWGRGRGAGGRAVETVQAALADQGKRARMAILATAGSFPGRDAMPAVLAIAARIMQHDQACRPTRLEIGRLAGVSADTVKRIEGQVVRRVRARLEAA